MNVRRSRSSRRRGIRPYRCTVSEIKTTERIFSLSTKLRKVPFCKCPLLFWKALRGGPEVPHRRAGALSLCTAFGTYPQDRTFIPIRLMRLHTSRAVFLIFTLTKASPFTSGRCERKRHGKHRELLERSPTRSGRASHRAPAQRCLAPDGMKPVSIASEAHPHRDGSIGLRGAGGARWCKAVTSRSDCHAWPFSKRRPKPVHTCSCAPTASSPWGTKVGFSGSAGGVMGQTAYCHQPHPMRQWPSDLSNRD